MELNEEQGVPEIIAAADQLPPLSKLDIHTCKVIGERKVIIGHKNNK